MPAGNVERWPRADPVVACSQAFAQRPQFGMSARQYMPAHRATGYGVGEGSAGRAEVLYLFLAATTAA